MDWSSNNSSRHLDFQDIGGKKFQMNRPKVPSVIDSFNLYFIWNYDTLVSTSENTSRYYMY